MRSGRVADRGRETGRVSEGRGVRMSGVHQA